VAMSFPFQMKAFRTQISCDEVQAAC